MMKVLLVLLRLVRDSGEHVHGRNGRWMVLDHKPTSATSSSTCTSSSSGKAGVARSGAAVPVAVVLLLLLLPLLVVIVALLASRVDFALCIAKRAQTTTSSFP